MKKYAYIGILSILLVMAYAGFNLLKESYAAGNYRFFDRYKSNIKFVQPDIVSSTTMGYFTIVDGNSNKITTFCGSYGKQIWSGESRTYTRYDFDSYYYYQTEAWRTKVRNILLLYSPDYDSTSTVALENLKSYLQTNYSQIYAESGMNALTVPEATATFQGVLWHFTNNDEWFYYSRGTQTYIRTTALRNILLQDEEYLKNINTYTSAVNFEIKSSLAWDNNNIVTTIAPSSGVSFDYESDAYNIIFKTNTGITISADNYISTYDNITGGMKYTISGITQNDESKLIYNGSVFDTLIATISATSNTMTGKKTYVYAPDTNSNFQVYFGAETSPISTSQTLTLPAPELQHVSIKFNKVDINNLSGSNLPGAYLKLYRVENENRVLIKEWATGRSYYEISNLIPGIYVIDETITPTGYQLVENYSNYDNETNTLYISSGKNFEITSNTINVNIVNQKTKISILKQDLNNNNIAGAKFNIIDVNGDIYYTFTSTTTAISIEGKLETGVYFLEEIEAPTNYKKSDKLYRFVVGDRNDIILVNGQLPGLASNIDELYPNKHYSTKEIVDITLGNNNLVTLKNQKGVVITKRDIANTNLYVVGAKLTITKQGTEEIVEEWTTTDEEHFIFLEDGNYTLTETITPNAYATAESIDFTITNGVVVNNTDLNMKDSRLNVCIAKKATDIIDNLPGAKFEVYDSDNVLIASFTSTIDEYCFNNDTSKAITNDKIKPGTYTIKEVSAPSGYKYRTQTTQMVIENTSELQLFEIYNEISVPKTDLNVDRIIYITAIVFGTCGIGLILYYVKKYSY